MGSRRTCTSSCRAAAAEFGPGGAEAGRVCCIIYQLDGEQERRALTCMFSTSQTPLTICCPPAPAGLCLRLRLRHRLRLSVWTRTAGVHQAERGARVLWTQQPSVNISFPLEQPPTAYLLLDLFMGGGTPSFCWSATSRPIGTLSKKLLDLLVFLVFLRRGCQRRGLLTFSWLDEPSPTPTILYHPDVAHLWQHLLNSSSRTGPGGGAAFRISDPLT